MRIRKTIAAVSTLGVAMLSTTATAPAAHAGNYGCSGSYSWSSPVPRYDNGEQLWSEPVGTIYDYFDGTNNCSVFVKNTLGGYGVPEQTSISIYNQRGDWGPGQYDTGFYSYYAGPVSVNGVGTCVRESVHLDDSSGNYLADYETPLHSCG